MRIAVVEDNACMAALVRTALARAHFPADVYASIAAARYWLPKHAYGALVLDRGLPDGDGLALVAGLRARGCGLPCLVLSARDAIHDRVAGLEHGADDYLPKPFAVEELVARVRALLRRPTQVATRCHGVGNMRVDVDAGHVDVDGVAMRLPPAEFRLLCALAEAGGNTCMHARLRDAAFGPFSEVTHNALEVAIHRLRTRLGAHGANVEIVNVRGMGFALVVRDGA